MKKIIRVGSLEGRLSIPKEAKGLVLFAHGSGSGRLSPRNNFVADVLHTASQATLLIDLLTQEEDVNYETRFDISLLTMRLQVVFEWLKNSAETKSFPIGLFGASTGAAAALKLAALLGNEIKAVVSRGGRPDLAMEELNKVTLPTLIIVGGNDFGVIEVNQEAFKKLKCKKAFKIVPHATHLFEEPGTLESVAEEAKTWFNEHF